MITRKTTAVLSSGVIASAALAFLTGGTAAAVPDEDVLAHADLNGDGADETVTIRSAGTAQQELVTEVDGQRLAASAPADTPSDVRLPRVTDVNGDGAEELVVSELTGANTETFGIWEYVDGTLRQVAGPNGDLLRLYEGGGVTARSGYTCEKFGPGSQLVVLSAEADDTARDTITYTGSWTYYALTDGVATPTGTTVSFTSVSGENPLMNPDNGSCAP